MLLFVWVLKYLLDYGDAWSVLFETALMYKEQPILRGTYSLSSNWKLNVLSSALRRVPWKSNWLSISVNNACLFQFSSWIKQDVVLLLCDDLRYVCIYIIGPILDEMLRSKSSKCRHTLLILLILVTLTHDSFNMSSYLFE